MTPEEITRLRAASRLVLAGLGSARKRQAVYLAAKAALEEDARP